MQCVVFIIAQQLILSLPFFKHAYINDSNNAIDNENLHSNHYFSIFLCHSKNFFCLLKAYRRFNYNICS